jgi:uncharacterized protein YndB with AHSA1/START domain
MDSLTATSSITINASPEKVWQAITVPEMIKQYMYGAEVISDWQKGSPIIYKGVWEGRPYEDKGTILEIKPNELLTFTYLSAMSGLPDKPENYNEVSFALSKTGENQTNFTVTQTNNPSPEAVKKAEGTWAMMLGGIKKLLEA